MKKVLLYNPPGGLWLRGEARCEQDLDNATAYTATAPTTLCYMAAIFREHGIEPKVVDCPVEGIDGESFATIVRDFAPDLAILNASVLNLPNDLQTVTALRRISPGSCNAVVLPYFNSVPMDKIVYDDFRETDLIIIGEMEAVAYDLAEMVTGSRAPEEVRGVLRNDRATATLHKSAAIPPMENLDALPLPARDLIRNELYLRPDVGRPMATIVDGRGCPSSCIYCLAPITTGKRVRKRSAESVLSEITHCVERYGIRDFLFRADTFTIPKEWVLQLCAGITERGLDISWAANSKTTTFDEEIAAAMKRSGCFLVEFGIESGSDKSLKLQKKGTTTAHAIKAVAAAKKAGLLTYGTVLIGFPWETLEDLKETESFILRLNLDFIEIHVVAPYMGTELYDMMTAEGLIDGDAIGHDMIRNPVSKGTRHVSRECLLDFRKKFLRRFYMRPSYVMRTLARLSSFSQLAQYGKYGLRLCRNLIAG